MLNKLKLLLLDNNGKIYPQRCNKRFLIKHNLYDFIESSFDKSYTLPEKIYCLLNNLIERPKCKTCNNELIFKHGYSTFCSRKCSVKDKDVLIKNSIGVSKSLKLAYELNGDSIKHKRNVTLKNKYGQDVNSPFSISEVKEKIRNTMNSKYGVDNIFYLKEYRSCGKTISQKRSITRNNVYGYDIEYIDRNFIEIKNLCSIHGNVTMNANDFYNRTYRNRNNIQCILCNPLHSYSSLESKFEDLLNELDIKNYSKNTKNVIYPYEIDFYFHDYMLAIELNGVYWHSELHKDSNYHKNKTELCEKQGIRLLHIWEDDFYDKYDIIKSMLMNIFKIKEKVVYARKCNIKQISSKDYSNFIIDNHIQGKVNSSIRLGLYNNEELIAVMGFGKTRIALGKKSLSHIYELHRYCTKKYYSVPGAASKLLMYFEKHYQYDKLLSYAKRDYSQGNLYKTLSFNFIKYSSPGYYWIIDGKRHHRFNYRKDKISDETNKHKTEIQIMHEKGYIRCYDSGNLLFEKQHIAN
jgi:very-short-patch-repair endonuclease